MKLTLCGTALSLSIADCPPRLDKQTLTQQCAVRGLQPEGKLPQILVPGGSEGSRAPSTYVRVSRVQLRSPGPAQSAEASRTSKMSMT